MARAFTTGIGSPTTAVIGTMYGAARNLEPQWQDKNEQLDREDRNLVGWGGTLPSYAQNEGHTEILGHPQSPLDAPRERLVQRSK